MGAGLKRYIRVSVRWRVLVLECKSGQYIRARFSIMCPFIPSLLLFEGTNKQIRSFGGSVTWPSRYLGVGVQGSSVYMRLGFWVCHKVLRNQKL